MAVSMSGGATRAEEASRPRTQPEPQVTGGSPIAVAAAAARATWQAARAARAPGVLSRGPADGSGRSCPQSSCGPAFGTFYVERCV